MATFTDAERAFIGNAENPGEVRLAHIATSTPDGQPHVVPLRAMMDPSGDLVLVLGFEMSKSYKYRQVQKNPKVAVCWDGGGADGIKGVEVRGTAVIAWPDGEKDPHFVVTPTKVFSWGINENATESFEKKMGFDMSHLRG